MHTYNQSSFSVCRNALKLTYEHISVKYTKLEKISKQDMKGMGQGGQILVITRLFCEVGTKKLTTTRLPEHDILSATSVVL
jgi:hypothetical protein